MRFRGKDDSSWFWDGDRGTKSSYICTTTIYHMRVYADSDDHFYNVHWGYFVLGTTHIDYRECVPLAMWFGESEQSEEHFNDKVDDYNASVPEDERITSHDDHLDFHNFESFRQVGNHRVRNSGYASAHHLP